MLIAISVIVGVFIYYEQIAILYVAVTLSIAALLLVVAFADLEKVGVDTFLDDARK